tara:strand:+ start:85 stop:567 length:483 start_codon:yes stop_codon:yes gene_type:complete
MIFNSWKIRKKVPENKTSFMKETYEKESTNIISEETFETNSSPSLLGKEIKILGKISSTGALQLDGVLEGEIKASKLVIERSAKVVGSVTSEDLVIKGRIIGPVFGKKVRFGASARVEGDTFHETIAIEDGAYYEGSIRRQSNVSDTPNTATNDKLAKNN